MKFESKLRALAVVPVVLFHAKITGFDGGFVGVDIFFVTSGFLITGIISEELQQGNFRLSKFYERRVRRILPTLFFMMIICGPFAYLWMLPDELENFGQSFVATAFSANNILLTLTSNYWDLASEFKPLIHTWSLAVEEQYYFAFHLIMMGIWKRGRSSVLYILTTIFGISLSFAIVVHMFSLNQLASSAVFYLPPTRIWELLLGAMAAMVFSSGRLKPSRGFVEILGILGLVLISVSVILFDKSLPSPSAYTLVPTIGATLIILFADVRSAAGRLLSWGPLVWIGLISYSLYLWHQPLFAFLRIYSREEPGTWQMAGAILVTVCLSALSWRYVEQPFRKSGVVSRGAVLGSSLLIGLALVLVGFTLHRSQGFPSRLYAADVIQPNALNISYNESVFRFKKDNFEEGGKTRVLVLGNSFARDFINMMSETFPIEAIEIAYRDDFGDCLGILESSDLGLLYRNADAIVIASGGASDDCIATDIAMTDLAEKSLYYIGTKQFGCNMNWLIRLPFNQRGVQCNDILEVTLNQEEWMKNRIPAANFISLLAPTRQGDRIPFTDANGRLLSPDRTHLTKYGAIFFGDRALRSSSLSELFGVGIQD